MPLLGKTPNTVLVFCNKCRGRLTKSGRTYGVGVATDSAGYIYVSGSTNDNFDSGFVMNGSYHLFVTKWDSSGTRVWTKMHDAGGDTYDTYAGGVALDSSGNIFVTGNAYGNFFNTSFVVKYDGNGILKWDQPISTSGNVVPTGVDVDGSGNVYVTGNTTVGLDGYTQATGADVFIAKLNNAGEKQWVRQRGEGVVQGTAVATTAGGSVFVAGYTYNNLDGQQKTCSSHDAFIMRYDSAGNKK